VRLQEALRKKKILKNQLRRRQNNNNTIMCGIFSIFSSSLPEPDLRKELINCSQKLRHRGPDWSGYMVIEADASKGIPLAHGIGHERLAIMDPESGSQPLVSRDGNIVVAANGEIYNFKELYTTLEKPYTPMTGSDCEVILPLYDQHGPTLEMISSLRGMFSFILYDKSTDTYLVARDHIGITPLYIGWGNDGSVYVSSELKSLIGECNKFQNFPPGHIYCSKGEHAGQFQRWYKPNWAPEMLPGGMMPREPYQAVSFFFFFFFDDIRIKLSGSILRNLFVVWSGTYTKNLINIVSHNTTCIHFFLL
jgi:asparagine synthase (glutamine-hydrolysing)